MFDGLTLTIAIVVPLITGFIGYITNWAAVKMIFAPKEFIGVGPVGWQGVVPSRNAKFANDVADTVGDILSARELAERLDPAEMEKSLSSLLDQEIPPLVAQVAELLAPGVWEEMAPPARDMVLAQLRTEGSRVSQELFTDLREVSDELLDLRSLVVDLLSGENAERLTDLFQRMGKRELKFIEYYGGIFGFIVGIIQVLLYGLLGQWWMLPIVGLVVGLGTNWLALQMIFRPLEPTTFFGLFTVQGMFPKRQAAIAKEYADVAAEEIFTPENLLRMLAEGNTGKRLAETILIKVDESIEAQRPMIEMLTQSELTDEKVERVQLQLVQAISDRAPEVRDEIEAEIESRLAIGSLVETRIAALSKTEFERLLRGIFEEDEWILIVIGGALGGLVGLAQAGITSM